MSFNHNNQKHLLELLECCLGTPLEPDQSIKNALRVRTAKKRERGKRGFSSDGKYYMRNSWTRARRRRGKRMTAKGLCFKEFHKNEKNRKSPKIFKGRPSAALSLDVESSEDGRLKANRSKTASKIRPRSPLTEKRRNLFDHYIGTRLSYHKPKQDRKVEAIRSIDHKSKRKNHTQQKINFFKFKIFLMR